MTRGNQRDKAREKAAKADKGKTKAASEQAGNKGLNMEQRKQRDADSQQNLRTAAIQRGRGDSLFENGGEASPSSIRDKQNVVQRQVIL